MLRRYMLSLPERTLRAGAALGGGLVAESAGVLLPRALRRTRLYQATVERLLRIVVELVGDVKGVYPPDAMPITELAVRKTAGNALELAGLVAVGWSPLWLLAAAADLTGGTRTYLTALVEELKTAGLVPADVSIGSVEELLAALEQTSGVLAETVDVPPLNVADMRATWRELQEHADALPDAASLQQLYTALQEAGAREGRSTLEVSSLIAAGALRAGIRLGDTYIFAYYREALGDIAAEGLWRYLRRVSRPYLRGVRQHFDPRTATLTDRLLDRRSAR